MLAELFCLGFGGDLGSGGVCVFRFTLFKINNGPSWWLNYQAKVAGSLHGWKNRYPHSIQTWEKNPRCGSRWNIETLSEHVGMRFRKLKPTWYWIWQGLWRAIGRASTGTSVVKATLENVGPLLNGGLAMEELNSFNIFACSFTLAFTAKICLQKSQAPETHGEVWSKERLSEGLNYVIFRDPSKLKLYVSLMSSRKTVDSTRETVSLSQIF